MRRKFSNRLGGVQRSNKLDGRSIKHVDWLTWYQKGTNNKWTYDHIDHLMIDLETIITLACMTYIVDLDAYECHWGVMKNLQ